MESNEGAVFTYWPEITKFEDTGYITHVLGNGKITGKVVPSNDQGGYAIDLTITDDNDEEICAITLDRTAALCLTDVLIKNILNQQEVCDAERKKLNEACSRLGRREGDRQSDDATSEGSGGSRGTLPRTD